MANERNTLWRQGHVLSEEAANALNLKHHEFPEKTLVIIVSHDCDLANGQEIYFEAVIGIKIEKADGNFTHAKNARKLHLDFKLDDKTIIIELIADKTKLLKRALAEYRPEARFQLESRNKDILQRWLAVRYRRAAFSDLFNTKLKETGLDNQLSKILRPFGSYIAAIFFDVDFGEEIDKENSDDPYVLSIIILYTTDNYEEAYAGAMQAKQKIERVFKEKLINKDSNQWEHIELKDCEVMSDEALTYRQSTFFKQWRLEHISLREDPAQPMIEQ